MATVQAVNARLRKLTALGYLEPVTLNEGRGSGAYAYGLGRAGRALLQHLTATRGRGAPGPVWHHLEIAEFRVRFQEALEQHAGVLAEWIGEPTMRSLFVGRRGWPVPDALVHWQVFGREGTFLLEWDRGTESLAVVCAKLERYAEYWRSRGHRELLPGLGLRPRLLLVLNTRNRVERTGAWFRARRGDPLPSTVLLGLATSVLDRPLGRVWWRSDADRPLTLHE